MLHVEYRPQLATLAAEPPTGDEWLSELKYDGYRMGALLVSATSVRLVSRNGREWAGSFPEIVDALRDLPVAPALFDGELAVLLPGGKTSFQSLQNAMTATARAHLVYFIFDALVLRGQDLRAHPLELRKQQLAQVLAAAPARLRCVEHVVGEGPAVFRRACELGAEGIVCKRRDRPYRPGRNTDWLKVKCLRRSRFVIAGFTEPAGARAGLGGLLVGYYDGGLLQYAGRVGTGKGFTVAFLLELRKVLGELEQPQCPFAPRSRRALPRKAHWLRPEIVIEVAYLERTSDGYLRHPSFAAFCPGVDARSVLNPE